MTGLQEHQVVLLNETGIEWSEGRGSVELDASLLSAEQLCMLIGAGCFTYGVEKESMRPEDRHELHYHAAKDLARYFVGVDEPMGTGNLVLRRSIVSSRKQGGLHVLVHPITEHGVDTGSYKVVWGNP